MGNLHKGHRKSLKERIEKEGIDNLKEHEVLEALLYFSISRKDTNALAHELLNRFGSLSAIFESSDSELIDVEGVGSNTSFLLRFMPLLFRRYMMSKTDTGVCVDSSEKAGRHILPYFLGRKNEVVYLMCLDAKYKVISVSLLAEGSINSAHVSIRRVVEIALNSKASSVILAHNHTSGIALPSGDDEATTSHMRSALRSVGIILSDHLIIADDDFVSMADSGYFK